MGCFERQLHIPIVVRIPYISLEIVEHNKGIKANIFLHQLVLMKVLKNNRKFKQLMRFCC